MTICLIKSPIYFGTSQNRNEQTPNISSKNTVKTAVIGAAGAITGVLLTKDKDINDNGLRYKKIKQEGEKPLLALKMKMKTHGNYWKNAIIGALVFIAGDYIGEKLYNQTQNK